VAKIPPQRQIKKKLRIEHLRVLCFAAKHTCAAGTGYNFTFAWAKAVAKVLFKKIKNFCVE